VRGPVQSWRSLCSECAAAGAPATWTRLRRSPDPYPRSSAALASTRQARCAARSVVEPPGRLPSRGRRASLAPGTRARGCCSGVHRGAPSDGQMRQITLGVAEGAALGLAPSEAGAGRSEAARSPSCSSSPAKVLFIQRESCLREKTMRAVCASARVPRASPRRAGNDRSAAERGPW